MESTGMNEINTAELRRSLTVAQNRVKASNSALSRLMSDVQEAIGINDAQAATILELRREKTAAVDAARQMMDADRATIADRDAEIERLRARNTELEALFQPADDGEPYPHIEQYVNIAAYNRVQADNARLTRELEAANEHIDVLAVAIKERDILRGRCDALESDLINATMNLEHTEQDLAAMTERCAWVPVAERMPDVGRRVITKWGRFVGEAQLGKDGKWYRGCLDADAWFDGRATHWMPMPQPPTAEKGTDNA